MIAFIILGVLLGAASTENYHFQVCLKDKFKSPTCAFEKAMQGKEPIHK